MPPERVQFEESKRVVYGPQEPYMVRLVKRWGLATDQRGAEKILVYVAGGAIVLAIVAYFALAPSVARFSDDERRAIEASTPMPVR